MNNLDLQYLCDYIRQKSGITLSEDKLYLIESRLKPIARKYGMQALEELVAKIRSNSDPVMNAEIIDSMTTNESYFFRDTLPFEQFKRAVMPKLRNKKIRIWSAAASTGQEAYSLAITMREMGFTNYEIYGSDISPRVIEKARLGRFSQFEVQRGLPIMLLMKYFTQTPDGWDVKPDLKNNIKFDTFNLLDDYTRLGQFDVILIRNVLIYFEKPTKTAIFDKMYRAINREGFMFLGTSETIIGVTDKFVASPGENGMFIPKP